MPFAVGRVVFQSPLTTRKPGDLIEIRDREKQVISTLSKTVESQRQTIVLLERKIDDLSKQNIEYLKSKVITPEEQVMFRNQSQLIIDLQNERNQLAVWLRENKSIEIAQGKHAGKELIPLILQYLGGNLPGPDTPLVPTPTPGKEPVQ